MEAASSVAAAFPELDPPAAHALERRLVAAARARGANGHGVSSVQRAPLDSTWYRTEVVSVTLGDAGTVRFFLKDFGSYVRPKSRMTDRRERERYFYSHVFPRGELGLPAFVADVWDGATWLVLEHVDGVPLAWCEVDVWHDAAAWLGRFQSAVADRKDELAASGRFTTHGPAYFEKIVRRAVEGAGAYDPALAESVQSALPLYEERTAALMLAPQTLVHGAFRPDQVLVDASRDPVRICPTDWEISAMGSCLYDLATLADGFTGAALDVFLERFAAEAAWLDRAPEPDDLATALAACRMHRTMKWVAHGHARGMPEDKVRALLDSLTERGRR